MGKEESPQITRRTTRSSSSTPIKKNEEGTTKTREPRPLTIHDLAFGGEPMTLGEVISSFPGRKTQILELNRLLGPLNSPMLPLFLYGGASTGKTSIVLHMFRHLKCPFVYSSCLTCYSSRILFESILNQLLLHRKNAGNGYASAKRCERPSDFVVYLQEALTNILNTLKGNSGKSKSGKLGRQANGKMIYLIFDNLELVREWDKSSTILPFLFDLYDILKMPEVGLIFISKVSPDAYYSNTGFVEPIPIHFPDYSEDSLRKIFMRNKANPKLYSSFLDVVLRPFSRISRRVDELSAAFSPLFKKYCEPLSETEFVPNEDMKRKLFSHLQPHFAPALNEIFRVESQPSPNVVVYQEKTKRKSSTGKLGLHEVNDELDFHMPTSAKYLIISAFLASKNPATLDASLFDSTGGSENRKRKRKSSEKSMEGKETAEQELLMKGPGTFPLERLLAIFQCITSVADLDEDQQINGLGACNGDSNLMSDILLQLSGLCNANFITKGGSCPLEGSTRYRATISEELALKSISNPSGLVSTMSGFTLCSTEMECHHSDHGSGPQLNFDFGEDLLDQTSE